VLASGSSSDVRIATLLGGLKSMAQTLRSRRLPGGVFNRTAPKLDQTSTLQHPIVDGLRSIGVVQDLAELPPVYPKPHGG
jgi:hypothetical protein